MAAPVPLYAPLNHSEDSGAPQVRDPAITVASAGGGGCRRRVARWSAAKANCPEPVRSAAALPPRLRPRNTRPQLVSAINVALPLRSQGSATLAPGPPARPRPRLRRRPAAAPAGRRARGRRLLPGVAESASGAATDRPTLEQVLDQLRPGDTRVVWQPTGWAGRCATWSTPSPGLAERGVGVAASQEPGRHHQPRRHARRPGFAALAEFERDRIRGRTSAGLAHARGR
jgi:hypothetical protein